MWVRCAGKVRCHDLPHSLQPSHCTLCANSMANLDAASRSSTSEKAAGCCDRCGKRFSKREHLYRHLRSHTNERPYSCRYCHKSYGRRWVQISSAVESSYSDFAAMSCDGMRGLTRKMVLQLSLSQCLRTQTQVSFKRSQLTWTHCRYPSRHHISPARDRKDG